MSGDGGREKSLKQRRQLRNRPAPPAPSHLQEPREEECEMLHEGLLLIRALLIGLGNVDGGGHHRGELRHEDLEEALKVWIELGAHDQGADLNREGGDLNQRGWSGGRGGDSEPMTRELS